MRLVRAIEVRSTKPLLQRTAYEPVDHDKSLVPKLAYFTLIFSMARIWFFRGEA